MNCRFLPIVPSPTWRLLNRNFREPRILIEKKDTERTKSQRTEKPQPKTDYQTTIRDSRLFPSQKSIPFPKVAENLLAASPVPIGKVQPLVFAVALNFVT